MAPLLPEEGWHEVPGWWEGTVKKYAKREATIMGEK